MGKIQQENWGNPLAVPAGLMLDLGQEQRLNPLRFVIAGRKRRK
jgi:hypothetical protein